MKIIENSQDLATLCQTLHQQSFITVDSEFVRERTYFSKLCLIQVGWLDDAAIIDPLAPEIDLTPFLDVLQDQNVLKVFHSGRQDIEIFYHMNGKIPTPVFDTQIAAMVCGFGSSISYGDLVLAITKIELDKSSRLTDWSCRPLDNKQLEYALRDVTFLIPCYQYLEKYLKENNREEWIREETAALCDESLYKVDPDNAWRRLHYTAHSLQFLTILKELAAWRELRAIHSNVPRQNIIKDEMLLNVAAIAPKTTEDLLKARNIRSDVAKGKLGVEMVNAVQTALSKPADKELRKIDREKRIHIPGNASALMEVLKLLLKIKSEQNGVVAKLIASDQDLRDIACGNKDKENKALQGWRYEFFGREALDFRKGLSSIMYDSKQKKIVIVNQQKEA